MQWGSPKNVGQHDSDNKLPTFERFVGLLSAMFNPQFMPHYVDVLERGEANSDQDMQVLEDLSSQNVPLLPGFKLCAFRRHWLLLTARITSL